MLLIIGKGIKVRICHSIYSDAKADNKYLKDCEKNKELPNLQYWDFPVNNFDWIKDNSQLNKDFIKTLMK